MSQVSVQAVDTFHEEIDRFFRRHNIEKITHHEEEGKQQEIIMEATKVPAVDADPQKLLSTTKKKEEEELQYWYKADQKLVRSKQMTKLI
ncbi:hypothetical protein OROHE_019605 [Orobanche hederae]